MVTRTASQPEASRITSSSSTSTRHHFITSRTFLDNSPFGSLSARTLPPTCTATGLARCLLTPNLSGLIVPALQTARPTVPTRAVQHLVELSSTSSQRVPSIAYIAFVDVTSDELLTIHTFLPGHDHRLRLLPPRALAQRLLSHEVDPTGLSASRWETQCPLSVPPAGVSIQELVFPHFSLMVLLQVGRKITSTSLPWRIVSGKQWQIFYNTLRMYVECRLTLGWQF